MPTSSREDFVNGLLRLKKGGKRTLEAFVTFCFKALRRQK